MARLVEQVFEHLVRRAEEVEEVADRPALLDGQRTLTGEGVDEEAVPEIGGNPTGRRVRLRDEALALEDGHVVADRGARHPEVA